MGAARRAAAATVQLEALEEALAQGQEIDALAYSRLDGVLRRNRRSLGLDEGDPLSSGNGAAPRAGASSRQKKVPPTLSLRDEMEAEEEARIAAMTPEQKRAHYAVVAGPDHVAAVRASTAVAIASATPKQVEMFRLRLLALDVAEGKTKPDLPNEIDGKKSFAAHSGSPRSDE